MIPAFRLPEQSHCKYTALLLLILCCVSAHGIRAQAEKAQPQLPVLEVTINQKPLTMEIANTDRQRYMGLSFRQSLPENAGMLFVYPNERQLSFTMRNTLIPLSIAFLSKDLVINEIHDMDVGPGQIFNSRKPAQYALEVNQGWFKRNGIKSGDKLTAE